MLFLFNGKELLKSGIAKYQYPFNQVKHPSSIFLFFILRNLIFHWFARINQDSERVLKGCSTQNKVPVFRLDQLKVPVFRLDQLAIEIVANITFIQLFQTSRFGFPTWKKYIIAWPYSWEALFCTSRKPGYPHRCEWKSMEGLNGSLFQKGKEN